VRNGRRADLDLIEDAVKRMTTWHKRDWQQFYAGRIGAYGPNVTVLRDFVRSSRQPL
jgi:hypothetical protein